uniref:PS II complex 12 kDa extrinsic protein n=1 Tax=Thalassionema nitzschioides TaxID=33649 RepID=A0A7S1E9J8_9STRA|eukprot:CAMPEP_0194210508 /NCGR_PEP_ID=MMETSP0156-20130528/8641_1 /TAXON_ID=33649 /ORGANISM="Thalassionema nitzschioides, Strain L26-B" /LENGTH=124 /DNA_ID=CAMNT_0038937865 /DNA_START=77 /DNA_END=451 /DNA_ORIENTATION=-
MKIAIVSCLLATAVAFVPSANRRPSLSLKSTPVEEVTAVEKEQIMENVFECHGYFPDFREFDELPASVREMRSLSGDELKEATAKYSSMKDDSERCYQVLVDLGLLEDYSSLGEYSDNFDEYAK